MDLWVYFCENVFVVLWPSIFLDLSSVCVRLKVKLGSVVATAGDFLIVIYVDL